MNKIDALPLAEAAGLDAGLTVQQAAERTGLSEHTLRYYERVGLIQPVRRQGSGGHRRYSPRDLTTIETLACLRGAGMTLDQMRRYFELMPQGSAAAGQLQTLLRTQQQALEEQMTQMQGHLRYVSLKIAYWRAVELGDERAEADVLQQLADHLPTAACRLSRTTQGTGS